MSDTKKLKKKIKQLKHKLEKTPALNKQAKKELKHLRQETAAQQQTIAELRQQLKGRQPAAASSMDGLLQSDKDERSLALDHKNAWKRHSFLRERYEVHLETNDKDSARSKANSDLMKRFGKKVGFTPEELGDILS